MKLAVLFSSSKGNCSYIEAGDTKILVDAGGSLKQIKSCLAQVGVSVAQIDAVFVTHDHTDHTSALCQVEKHFQTPIYANDGTIDAILATRGSGELDWNFVSFETGSTFRVGSITVSAFSVSHDGADPVGYTFEADGKKLGYITDMGKATAMVREHLKRSDAIVMEFNHDVQMTRNSDRSQFLIQRNLGRNGHLSNADAATLLAQVAGDNLRMVVPAHISRDCNTPELALAAVEDGLRHAGLKRSAVRVFMPESYPMAVEVI